MTKFDDENTSKEDHTEKHMVEVWLHELQDHTNMIAEMPDSDPSSYLRAAFYQGATQGLNANREFQKRVLKRKRTEVSVTPLIIDEGYWWGEKFRHRLQKEDRQEYRQKMVASLKSKLTKITPWEDQTKTPL